MQMERRITISYSQAWRAKNFALNDLRGSQEESFAILPQYCAMLEYVNPGTVTAIETDNAHHFKYFFMALGASLRGFQQYIRPVICVDGAFLKGKYFGTLFVAVAKDGNNQIYPIAFGVGDSENDDSWEWFMGKLRDAIGNVENIVIISDRHKSIEKAVNVVFPHAVHGACCHHLRMNMRAKFKKTAMEGLYWAAAKAYRLSDFNDTMSLIQHLSPNAFNYLTDVGFHKWARAHFEGRRYNIMTTNIAESMNNVFKYARGLPITMLAEYMRSCLQDWFYSRRGVAANLTSHLTKWASDRVASHIEKAATMIVHPVNDYVYDVHDTNKGGIVKLHDCTCTCRKFQLEQLPCAHVAAVARYLRLSNCYQWCHRFYTADSLRNAYHEPINALGHQSEWISSGEDMVVLPPLRRSRQPGRPCQERILSRGEETRRRKCGRCGGVGHTRLNCRTPMPMPRPSMNASTSESRTNQSR